MVPAQVWTGAGAVEAEELIDRLSREFERVISFSEECRWRVPELSAEADQLTAHAMALFGKTLRSLQQQGGNRPSPPGGPPVEDAIRPAVDL